MNHQRKCLLIRLSSLGDLILSTSALQVAALPPQVDWVTSSEYQTLLSGHPRIKRVHGFHRRSGLRGWIQFCRMLWLEGYDEVYDLHRNLRTRLMRVLFLFWGIQGARVMPRWKSISKQKFRLWGFLAFKRGWPKCFRPQPWVEVFSRCVGGTGQERPQLEYLCQQGKAKDLGFVPPERWVCVMPSSRWRGKIWPVSHYADLIAQLGIFPVVLGTKSDSESLELTDELRLRGVPFFSAIGKWDFSTTALALSQSTEGYLGNDTGLAHLAEAVGARANIIYGPTHPDLGFGPWGPKGRALQVSLSCRPCSRDGRACYRLAQPYLCMRALTVDHVRNQLTTVDE